MHAPIKLICAGRIGAGSDQLRIDSNIGECRNETKQQSSYHQYDGVCHAKPVGYHYQRQNDEDKINILNESALHEVNGIINIPKPFVRDPAVYTNVPFRKFIFL